MTLENRFLGDGLTNFPKFESFSASSQKDLRCLFKSISPFPMIYIELSVFQIHDNSKLKGNEESMIIVNSRERMGWNIHVMVN